VLLLSLGFGLWFITPENIWPTSVSWLRYGDMAFSQFGWEYFRHTPIFQWPITAVDSFGEGWDNVLAGQLVLPQLIFKLLSPILPSNFQFFGIWTLTNFGLQGFFAERLFNRLGLGITERVIGALSIVVAPAFLFRIAMTHLELSAHWLLLAAFLVYVSDQKQDVAKSFYVLCLLALLVNFYLFLMVFAIAVATQFKSFVLFKRNKHQALNSVFHVVSLTLLSGFTAWLLGAFSYSGSARGVGFFRLNLLAFVNAGYGFSESFSWSREVIPALRTRNFFVQEGEGFAYLGFVGLCGVVALVVFLRKWSTRQNWQFFAPLLAAAGFLFLVALSNRIAVVGREIVLPVPQSFIEARQIFRAATRFSWIAYYLILVFGWVGLCRLQKRARLAPISLALLLIVGGIDQWRGVAAIRATFLSGSSWQNSLKSAEWDTLGSSSSRMYLFPTFDVQADAEALPPGAETWLSGSDWVDLVGFGAQHQLVTNFAYIARPVTQQVETANKWLQSALDNGTLPANSIIFFARELDWRNAQERSTGDYLAKTLDGYFVIVTRGGE
jgi:hypothetical protein